MPKALSTGVCELCKETFSKVAMTRHLASCNCKPAEPKGDAGEALHLVVEGRYERDYWLHLAIPREAPLQTLDRFLRDIWLECCGHLSCFAIEGLRYASMPDGGEASMRVSVGKVLNVGTKFTYQYDYGSTTDLALKVPALRRREGKGRTVQLLARNTPPQILCAQCGKNKLATQICTECQWSGEGWLCDSCSAQHSCGEEMLLPIVNSPRTGVCGYTG